MRSGKLSLFIFVSLWGLAAGCRRPETQPVESPDPAALLEGVYGGDMYTRTHMFGVDGLMLLKQIAPNEVEMHSLHGGMTPYQLRLQMKGDSVLSPDDKWLDFRAKIDKGRPVALNIMRRNFSISRPNAVELSSFSWSSRVPFLPLSRFRADTPLASSSIAAQLAGFYNAWGKRRINNQESETGFLLGVRPVSNEVIEFIDRHGLYGPYRFSLQSQASGDWQGVSRDGKLRVRATVKDGQPQELYVESVSAQAPSSNELRAYLYRPGQGIFVSSQ